MLGTIKKIIPKPLFELFQPTYHYCLAVLGAVIYRFPSKKMLVVGVTGTKGKSTSAEMVNAILEEAGFKTALQSTIRFKIGEKEKRNLFKMSMPGRFFMQKFLREAVDANCEVAILELTSEGAKQFRHKFIDLDALIFTNLAPEHIESHGSYEKYREAKLSIAKGLESRQGNSKKNTSQKVLGSPFAEPRAQQRLFSKHFSLEFVRKSGSVMVANIDDKEGEKFLALNIKNKIPYSLRDAIGVKADEKGSSFQIGKMIIHSKLPGIFNVSNMLGAIAYAKFLGIKDETIKRALEKMDLVRGRMEKIDAGQGFDVVVDYAHTPDSLRAVYETYNPSTGSTSPLQAGSGQEKKHHLICVLGNTGGGRDTWKRPEMGKIADEYCAEIILTNEDPYDESPRKIVEDVKAGIKNKPVEIIMDRRAAIVFAINKASRFAEASRDKKVAVLITGKGTDPYIMEEGGKKTPWDDATVAREELIKILDIRK